MRQVGEGRREVVVGCRLRGGREKEIAMRQQQSRRQTCDDFDRVLPLAASVLHFLIFLSMT
eukprot:748505-Hanusia_phi.AAC.2